MTTFNPAAAEVFLKEASSMVGKDKESPIRHILSAHLPKMYPVDQPWWVSWHAKGSESVIHSHSEGKQKRGFIDTLVGSTAIEYEKDLSNQNLFEHGLEQVREYCTGLLNKNVPPGLIIGVLSDTLRWHAYRIESILPLPPGQKLYGKECIVLVEIDKGDFSAATQTDAVALGRFLSKHLGRVGGRVLAAETLAADLGFESSFCSGHIEDLADVVNAAFDGNPGYASLISRVWTSFVSYLGGSGANAEFDKETYVRELYILTLAKLLCANVLEGKPLVSDDKEIRDILEGGYFKAKGFSNLVEYDYFGWMAEGELSDASSPIAMIVPIARAIQNDLGAYDFSAPPAEDLFGALMAQLARRSQRLLLGQEWTPAWLARSLVENVMSRLPDDQHPRFVDMCCGSGSMVVETVKQTVSRFEKQGMHASRENVSFLAQAITGFDIDPLAVMLAKISWILAARPWLLKAGSYDVAIPVYHADSLFASTPVSKKISTEGTEQHELDLDGEKVMLPGFLMSSEHAPLFDPLVSKAYEIAMGAADSNPPMDLSGVPESVVKAACAQTETALDATKMQEALAFVADLLKTLESLQRGGRNGIWAFVLGNTYRPGLVSGRFNGLVSNPPWLAMSKVADNPYKETMVGMSESFGIKPTGSSHLHAELATLFLLHAVSRYLKQGAAVGCILPESVLSAHHHNPFRQGAYRTATKPVPFVQDEVWWIEKGTFKNEAVALFGTKVAPQATGFSGKIVSQGGFVNATPHLLTQGNRTAWSKNPAASGSTGFFSPAQFRQGADVFPRTAIFHALKASAGRVDVSPIAKPASPLTYLVKEAKKHKAFSISAKGVDEKYFFDVQMSNHLTAFDLASPAQGMLPVENVGGVWQPASAASILVSGTSTGEAFKQFFSVAGADSQAVFNSVDTDRKKLSNQSFPTEGWLVVMGAGGGIVCAAYKNMNSYSPTKLIVDQTLYWVVISDEDEAIYLTGLLNSDAINLVIGQFQPRGQFGARHVHTLPLGATPPYDPLDASHVDVVMRTKTLLAQWDADRAANPTIFRDLLDPNKSLAPRRRKLRLRLKLLPGYADYDLACRSLYAV